MIRAIVAIDEKRGLADDRGIPWDLPADKKFFRDKTMNGVVLMGYGTYVEFEKPLHNRLNYVASTKDEQLRDGFKKVSNAREFLQNAQADVWVIGGAGLFSQTMDLTDELYITQLEGDFNCTKFFPEYEKDFKLVSESDQLTENGITFRFTVWKIK